MEVALKHLSHFEGFHFSVSEQIRRRWCTALGLELGLVVVVGGGGGGGSGGGGVVVDDVGDIGPSMAEKSLQLRFD